MFEILCSLELRCLHKVVKLADALEDVIRRLDVNQYDSHQYEWLLKYLVANMVDCHMCHQRGLICVYCLRDVITEICQSIGLKLNLKAIVQPVRQVN